MDSSVGGGAITRDEIGLCLRAGEVLLQGRNTPPEISGFPCCHVS